MSDIGEVTTEKDYRYRKDPTSLTKFLKIMLWIFAGTCLIALFSGIMQMSLLYSETISQADLSANDLRQLIINYISTIVFVVTGIVFLKWIYRANLNCHGFSALKMEFTPGWAIGYFFIPMMNCFYPYWAMKEIWKVSTNPMDWKNEKGNPLLRWWWALWLTPLILSQFSDLLVNEANTLGEFKFAQAIGILALISRILLSIVAVKLISEIIRKQENLVKNVESLES